MKELVQKADLAAYLRGLGAASMLVVSMSSPVFEISSTVKSSFEMAYMVENYGQFIGEGPYMIESKDGREWKESQLPDPVITGYAFAFTVCARLVRSGKEIGGHHSLRNALSGYEFIQMDRLDESAMVSSVLIKMPTDPAELQTLRDILAETTVFFSVDDGSGYFHLGNTMMGNGIYHS
ncbi:hypothetical protein [Pseudomonas sp. BC115LW]|uniref:hypothetical protein n=1 Tax=Pseudomonas sp. BC115LW TaxID=2683267 RepID=UPI0014127918|nr:hypothetical protein [Pseudomonas sp. BC115LW]NBB33150.1 hypothetical protein [Pseudomonas sp. BC115LW]